jgi:beta-lactamase class A
MTTMLTRRCFSMGVGTILVDASQDSLTPELVRIEAGSGGRLGVAVHDTGSGRRYGLRQTERFPMCSTFKVLACGAVLAGVDTGRQDLGRRIRFDASDVVTYSPVTKDQAGGGGMTLGALCEAAMTQSDNTAANLILASVGGPAGVTAYARSIGDPVSRLDRIETELNEATPGDPRDTTTPDAMAANLRSLVVGDGLSRRSREQLRAWMVANQTGGAKLRAGVPRNWRVGDKTGSGGWGTTNDVAVLWPPDRNPLIVCVYLTDTKATFEASNATIAAVGRAVRTAFSR